MQQLLGAAGKAFLKAFGASLVILSTGLWTAPTLHGAELVAVAAVLGSLAAGVAALQAYVPSLTFAKYVKAPFGPWLDSFARAFLGTLIALVPGVFMAPNLTAAKAAGAAAIIGALNAGVHALQGFLTKGQLPAVTFGLKGPPPAPTKP